MTIPSSLERRKSKVKFLRGLSVRDVGYSVITKPVYRNFKAEISNFLSESMTFYFIPTSPEKYFFV